MFNNKWLSPSIFTALVGLSILGFQNNGMMSTSWTYPYFSGAANIERLFDWQVSASDYDTVIRFSPDEYRAYHHLKTPDTVKYTINNYGYVLVALAGRNLFPWMGDINAIILFQILVHWAATLFLFTVVFKNSYQKWAFVVLYAANPVVIYFVTYPFYYFWTFVPGMALVLTVFKPRWIKVAIPILTVGILFSILIRPTTVFSSVLVYLVAWLHGNVKGAKRIVFLSFLVFLLGVVGISKLNPSAPFHTMYVGIGAYHNDQGVEAPSDEEGFRYFAEKKGIIINTHPIEGNWDDPRVRSQYLEAIKSRYIEILGERPLLLLKNAALNTLQSFFLGYSQGKHGYLAFMGLLMLVFMVYAGQWLWIGAVLSYGASYVWYFPPIPAYHFGAYLLLVAGVIQALEKYLEKAKLDAWVGRKWLFVGR